MFRSPLSAVFTTCEKTENVKLLWVFELLWGNNQISSSAIDWVKTRILLQRNLKFNTMVYKADGLIFWLSGRTIELLFCFCLHAMSVIFLLYHVMYFSFYWWTELVVSIFLIYLDMLSLFFFNFSLTADTKVRDFGCINHKCNVWTYKDGYLRRVVVKDKNRVIQRKNIDHLSCHNIK